MEIYPKNKINPLRIAIAIVNVDISPGIRLIVMVMQKS
jgi:hypothetical protein